MNKIPLEIKHFKDGVYQGRFNDKGLRHGKGSFLWDTGEMYVGSWKDDDQHGEGIFCLANYGFMIGEFKYNTLDGAFYV